ncbi:MAG TPA: hypothetical protein VLJ15_08170 [Gammaproteobacteria bacterium]|nr:hypothetical protein [Gammaproteobacteria bacterium]
MKKKKIKDDRPVYSSRSIRETQKPLPDSTVHFSFKHLDMKNQKFNIDNRKTQYFIKMLERLKNLSTLSPQEILSNRSRALRAHPITWKDTSEKSGFNHLNEQLKEITPYQFEISRDEHGRVHGFFIDNIFFIIWFDPNHQLYSSQKAR